MLRPTMLRYVALTCCDRLAGALQSSERCRQSCSADRFEILDSAATKFKRKLQEAMYMNWENPKSNQQVHHVNLTLINSL